MLTFIQADAARIPLADGAVDLTVTSPPYLDARSYSAGMQRGLTSWVPWMLRVVGECCRVTRGIVVVICAGVTRKWCYQPGPEGLLYEWVRRGGMAWRPAFWHRVGIPGSGGKQWLRADIEYALCFTSCRGAIPWADNTANGHPPKWAPGGEMSYRVTDGHRRNQWGKHENSTTSNRKVDGTREKASRPSHLIGGRDAMGFHQYGGRGRKADGAKKACRRVPRGHDSEGNTIGEDAYVPPPLANPGCLIKGIKVGGGLMGHQLAHENEAPYPVKLAAWFIRGWCPPTVEEDGIVRPGRVLDPFSGSGTTAHAAAELGRDCIGMDLRFSQVELGARRCREVQGTLLG